jgi:hypothetical protein
MTVTVYARHSSQCSKSKEKNAGQWKRCKCPLWLQWNTNGNQFKKSAKTRSWDIATIRHDPARHTTAPVPLILCES